MNAPEISKLYQDAKNNKSTEKKAFSVIKEYLEQIYNSEGLNVFTKTIQEIAEICCIKSKDAETFAKGFFDVIAGGGDSLGNQEVILFEGLVSKFPDSAKLAEMLADIYGVIIDETQNEEYSTKLEQLSKNNPVLINAAMQYVYSLVDSVKVKEKADYEEVVRLVEDVYRKYNRVEFASQYSKALNFLVYKQPEEEALRSILIIEDLMNTWKVPNIANNFMDALSKLTRVQDEIGCAETIERMETYWDGWSYDRKFLAMNIAYTLANYSLCVEGSKKAKVIDKIKTLSIYWKPAETMAYELSKGTYEYAHKPAKAK